MNKKVILEKTIIGILLFLSLLLFSFPFIKKTFVVSKSNQYQIDKISKEEIKENLEKEVSYDWTEAKAITPAELIELTQSTSSLPVIGGITIPQLSVNLPIFNGTSNEAMSFGAGTLTENQVMGEGNYSLTSHRIFDIDNANELLFSPLVNAESGMKIYITDKELIYEYTVTEKFIVNPDQVEVIDEVPNQKLITLITCTDINASQRIIVRGELKNTYNSNTMPEEAKEGFKREYKIFNFYEYYS